MNFYVVLCYIFTYIHVAVCDSNSHLDIVDKGLVRVPSCSIGLQFYVTLNNTSEFDYDVELAPDQCCLEIGSDMDCDILDIIGRCSDTIFKGQTKSLNLIAPILDFYERKGYCIAYLDSKADRKRRAMRDSIKITFDTKLKSKNNYIDVPNGATVCKNIDEDPLNNCQPVDCEVFYNEKRSYYNRRLKRCMEVPPCINEGSKEMPSVIYDPVTNKCVGDEPLDKADYEFVKKLAHSNRIVKDVVIINTFKDGIEENDVIDFKKNSDNENFNLIKSGDIKRSCFVDALFDYINNHRSGLSLLGIIFLVQCGLICTMVYFLSKNCLCKRKNVLEKKFFNYRQDASVTTPLIGTTQVETETTCQFMSESSNIDKKIQCYKACQKDAKVSMSDDILSKCLNRRSWDRKEVKSDAMDFQKMKEISPKASKSDGSAKFETRFVSTRKQVEQKVNFENEKDVKYSKDDNRKSKNVKSQVKKAESKQSERKRGRLGDSSILEREIKCHSYNYVDSKVKDSSDRKGFSDIGLSEEIKCHSYNYMSGSAYSGVKTPIPNIRNFKKEEDSIITLSAPDKGQASVQASIANDSIDDYLSERGVLFLAGENISKYSFSNDSDIKSTSSISSKTSKNNIVKNVLSYLKRGSKHGPSSDPGTKKSKDGLNLELLHMSRVSMYSSSNNETSLKNLPRIKDSRTSL